MTVQEYLKKTDGADRRQPVTCASGLSLSIQAGPGHYSTPDSPKGPYVSVEVGYPNRRVPVLQRYQTRNNPQIYAYVGVEELEEVVKMNGGIVG